MVTTFHDLQTTFFLLIVLFIFFRTVLFPMLTDGVNWFIANVLSWLVPGLVTNFVYDALKRSIFRKQKS